jgi:acetate kinase
VLGSVDALVFSGGPVRVLRIRANEELAIARQAARLAGAEAEPGPAGME